MVSTSIILLQTRLPHTLMQTGLVVLTLEGPLPVFVFFLVTIWFLGLRKDRLQSHVRRPRLSIALWHMPLQIPSGFGSYSPSYTGLLSRPLLSTVTTYQQSTWPAIQFNTEHKVYWDWYSFCSWKGCSWSGSGASCSLYGSVCWHFHQGTAY